MGQWCQLPADLLKMIDESLAYVDKVSLRCVCMPWLYISPELPDLRQPQPPWLLLPCKRGTSCRLYHPFNNKVYEIDLPEKVFKGSGHGWVVTVQEDGSIHVVNPLSQIRFQLPPRYKFPDVLKYRPDKPGNEYLFVSDSFTGTRAPYTLDSMRVRNHKTLKIALSCSPTSDDFRAVALCGGNRRLAYCKLGDNKWCDLLQFGTSRFSKYTDITFCGGKLYALTCQGELMICDDIISRPKLKMLVPISPYEDLMYDNSCLINSSNGLLAVRRVEFCHDADGTDSKFIYKTMDFKVFKLGINWIPVESLGNDILFMGLGIQMSVSSQKFEGSIGNQIYFTSIHWNLNCHDIENCFDNGIFNLSDRKIISLGCECDPKIIWPSPIWVVPNPY